MNYWLPYSYYWFNYFKNPYFDFFFFFLLLFALVFVDCNWCYKSTIGHTSKTYSWCKIRDWRVEKACSWRCSPSSLLHRRRKRSKRLWKRRYSPREWKQSLNPPNQDSLFEENPPLPKKKKNFKSPLQKQTFEEKMLVQVIFKMDFFWLQLHTIPFSSFQPFFPFQVCVGFPSYLFYRIFIECDIHFFFWWRLVNLFLLLTVHRCCASLSFQGNSYWLLW